MVMKMIELEISFMDFDKETTSPSDYMEVVEYPDIFTKESVLTTSSSNSTFNCYNKAPVT